MKVECQRCDELFMSVNEALYCPECRAYLKTPVKRIVKKRIKYKKQTTCHDCGKSIRGSIGEARCRDCYRQYAKKTVWRSKADLKTTA